MGHPKQLPWGRGIVVSEETFRQLALEDPESHWELHRGFLCQKPPMTVEENQVACDLSRLSVDLDSLFA